MNDRLHPLLLLLTMCDLGFVHATGAVSTAALLPMWPLALASPWLRRLQRHFRYRVAWNAVVLVVFVLLVHHALTVGLLHLLEDGLLLAVLCQVHLINNIGEQQRPDLTFFNSFLIAFVSVFFAPDAYWSLLFVGHSLVFVPALQVYVLSRRSTTIDRDVGRMLVRDSLTRTAVVIVVAALVFVLWPRDFNRRGLLEEHLHLGERQTGLADRIDLAVNRASPLDDTVVLRVTPVDGRRVTIPSHWRATAFVQFDGRHWHAQEVGALGSRFATAPQWRREPDGHWRRPTRGDCHTLLDVVQFDRASDRLLAPLSAVALEPIDLRHCTLDPKSFGGLATLSPSEETAGPLHYTVGLAQPQAIEHIERRVRQRLLQLPAGRVPEVAVRLAERLRADLPAQASGMAIATAFATWLREHRRYRLPGEPGFADNFGEFLLGTGAGHCEYFATTLALLLRIAGVPCRLLGGYLLHEPTADGRGRIARGRDAHAWVEVLAADGRWHTIDPTPARDDDRRVEGSGGWFDGLAAWLQAKWDGITGFDADARQQLIRALAAMPARHPFACFACGGLLVLLFRRWRQGNRCPAIAEFERTVRRAGLRRRAGETPRELLARAATLGLAPQVLERLRHSTRDHEQRRYGR